MRTPTLIALVFLCGCTTEAELRTRAAIWTETVAGADYRALAECTHARLSSPVVQLAIDPVAQRSRVFNEHNSWEVAFIPTSRGVLVEHRRAPAVVLPRREEVHSAILSCTAR